MPGWGTEEQVKRGPTPRGSGMPPADPSCRPPHLPGQEVPTSGGPSSAGQRAGVTWLCVELGSAACESPAAGVLILSPGHTAPPIHPAQDRPAECRGWCPGPQDLPSLGGGAVPALSAWALQRPRVRVLSRSVHRWGHSPVLKVTWPDCLLLCYER